MNYRILLVLTSLISIFSCDNEVGNQTQKTDTPPVTQLRFGHDMHDKSAQHLAALKLAELVKHKTNGTVIISIYPDQSMGNDRQMIARTQSGELDIIIPPTAKLSHIIPKMQIFDLPYLFKDRTAAYSTLDGHVGRELLETLKPHGLIGLAFWESGFKQITSNKPIKKMEDFIGQRFRIMESPVIQEQFKQWGADAIPIDFGKTYDALKNNVVDGQENPLTSIFGKKFHHVQKHLILSNHGYLSQLLAISKSSFEKLTLRQQQALIESVNEATTYQREESSKQHDEILDKIKMTSIEISQFDETTKKQLEKRAISVLEKYRIPFGSRLIEQIIQQNQKNTTYKDNQIIIALDADMSGNSAMSGLSIKRGIELAIDEINQAGGLLGKELSLVVRDNSMIPAKGLDNLKEFKKIPNLVAVFGGISSPVVLSELNYIHENQILFLDPWAAATAIIDNGFKPNYVFRISVRDEYAAEALLNEALKKSNKVGFLLVNNLWGRSNFKALNSAASKHDNIETATEWFDWGETSFSEKIEALKNKNVEVIIYVGNPVEGSKFIHDLAKLESPPSVVSHWGITGSEFAEMASLALNKIDLSVLQTFSFINNDKKNVKQLAKKYHKKYFTKSNEEIVAPVGTAHAYDLTNILAKAIIQSQSTDMKVLRDQLENISYHKGLLKTYKRPFSSEQHDALDASSFIFSEYKNGHLHPKK
ncbi:DctP family TRAP transporter solute-binding subunit [Aliikangiella sp. IMCC44359]|uniref:DctP family TRAP transporter solute-binding subunit n=1 Tax=Aliikangiella sp. IMCC44359 TaxID=3459125 RepID=UPI00403ABFC8